MGIKEHLDSNCIDFTQEQNEGFYEEAAMCEEAAMEKSYRKEVLHPMTLHK